MTHLVWMSIGRRGLDYHRIAGDDRTACGRSTRTGVRLEVPQATQLYDGKPCPRCWPNGASS